MTELLASLIENALLTRFRNTLSNDPLLPYGDFILKLQVDELDKEPPIIIDDELIKFFAEKCKNLRERMLRFSQKRRKNKAHLLPLVLLGDRLINLSMVTYTHSDILDDHDAQEEQEEDEKNEETKTMELSSLVNGGQQIFKQMYNYYSGSSGSKPSLNQSTIKDSSNEKFQSQEMNETEKDDASIDVDEEKFYDSLSETVKLESVKSIYPKMIEEAWMR